MRAITYTNPGPAQEVLKLVDVDTPEPAAGEVRVKVHVSGVNPTDWKQRRRPVEFDFQIPNQDGSGVIDAVGQGVDTARVGRRVWMYFSAWQRSNGTAAEYICLPEHQAIALDDAASFDIGASLGIPALTAHRALFADGAIDGADILITGGAGAVGHAALQFAHRAGARTVATVSGPTKAAIASEAGADVVINYTDRDAMDQLRDAAPQGFARVVDVAPSTNTPITTSLIQPGAVIATYADDGPLSILPHMQANSTIRFLFVYTMGAKAVESAVAATVNMVAESAFKPLPFTRFALAQTAAAHDAVEEGVTGKVLIDVA